MGSLKHSLPVAIVRSIIIGSYFVFGVLSCSYGLWIAGTFFKNYPELAYVIVSSTKTTFLQLIVAVSSTINPCKIHISWDPNSMPQLNSFKVVDGQLSLILNPDSIFLSNHQIYTDWAFLWFINYTASMSDKIFIFLKDMSKIPVLGSGMRLFNFIYLSRRWGKDKINMTNQMLHIDANARGLGPDTGVKPVISANSRDPAIKTWPKGLKPEKLLPYSFILFPEGTVVSENTRNISATFCKNKNLPPLRHVLLPRTRGLMHLLRVLRKTILVVYDVTTGYSNLTPDECGEEKFSLKRYFLLGHSPESVHFHFRLFNLSEIPLGDPEIDIDELPQEVTDAFEKWLYNVWYEKDERMEYFFNHGSFENESPNNKTVVADFKLRKFYEAFYPYTPAALTIVLFRLAYLLARGVVSH